MFFIVLAVVVIVNGLHIAPPLLYERAVYIKGQQGRPRTWWDNWLVCIYLASAGICQLSLRNGVWISGAALIVVAAISCVVIPLAVRRRLSTNKGNRALSSSLGVISKDVAWRRYAAKQRSLDSTWRVASIAVPSTIDGAAIVMNFVAPSDVFVYVWVWFMPFLPLGAYIITSIGVLWYRDRLLQRRWSARMQNGLCVLCSYELGSQAIDVCPECGAHQWAGD
jgi:hypothetical protein